MVLSLLVYTLTMKNITLNRRETMALAVTVGASVLLLGAHISLSAFACNKGSPRLVPLSSDDARGQIIPHKKK